MNTEEVRYQREKDQAWHEKEQHAVLLATNANYVRDCLVPWVNTCHLGWLKDVSDEEKLDTLRMELNSGYFNEYRWKLRMAVEAACDILARKSRRVSTTPSRSIEPTTRGLVPSHLKPMHFSYPCTRFLYS